jgi:2,5-dioxopentanoate dehydrogenase
MIEQIMHQSADAFEAYKQVSPAARATFLETIAAELEKQREQMVTTAGEETNLPPARLNGELTRTTNQLQLFADLIKEGSWVDAVIDTKTTDIRRMLMPIGPVVVFGASNFPFAFSTAGGDTASALAAGATVVVKGHPAHPRTSLLAYEAISSAIRICNMPPFTVQHVEGFGKELVIHPATTGVGFTGSLQGGKALMSYAAQREVPISVFAEMSSINPVVFYPDALQTQAAQWAQTFAASITLGMGQFCTNPGLLIGLKSEALDNFIHLLSEAIMATVPQKMLHTGIHDAYVKGRSDILSQGAVTLHSEADALPTLTSINAAEFLSNASLKEELFGPYSLLVSCEDKQELIAVLKSLKGQLTTTVVGTEKDTAEWQDTIASQTSLAGRIIFNQPPTGVEVCAAMVHGGPFPATSDPRFTSVGTSAIRRWVRPVCFQNFPDPLLPDALKKDNPLGIGRWTDNQFSR